MRTLFSLLASIVVLGAAGCNSSVPPIRDCHDCCGFDGECFPDDFPELDVSRTLPPLRRAEVPPPPLSGGTLLVPQSGDIVVVGDPDTDQVHIISLESGRPAARIASLTLDPGDEPGRIVEGAIGEQYYLVLRGGGAVLELDADLLVQRRFDVCASPRGVAFDPEASKVYIACLEGDLVTVDRASGEEITRRRLGSDLRDVVVAGEHVYVSHFRRAAVTVLPRSGDEEPIELPIEPHFETFDGSSQLMPAVAYRMIPHADRVIVLHQLARSQSDVQIEVSGGYGGVDCRPGLVQAAMTLIDGAAITRTFPLGNLVLPVDVAIRDSDEQVLVVAAGARTDTPAFGGRGFEGGASSGGLRAPAVAATTLSFIESDRAVDLGCSFGTFYDDGRRPTAAGFSNNGRTVILTRAPTALHVLETDEYVSLPGRRGREVYDAGHELFFGDSGAGIACASCHAEGGDDGLVWSFEGIGPRRTQELRGGILGTEPFHWDGDMADFQHLADEVFSGRMLGPELPPEYADALSGYIDVMPVPAHGADVDPLAAERGRVIFESAETQCSVCHGGPRLSSPGSFDVGTGGAFQVPSLVGVGLRAPYIHTGCADTLEDRFSAECGGATHGRVDHLAPEDMGDLIAYLETI